MQRQTVFTDNGFQHCFPYSDFHKLCLFLMPWARRSEPPTISVFSLVPCVPVQRFLQICNVLLRKTILKLFQYLPMQPFNFTAEKLWLSFRCPCPNFLELCCWHQIQTKHIYFFFISFKQYNICFNIWYGVSVLFANNRFTWFANNQILFLVTFFLNFHLFFYFYHLDSVPTCLEMMLQLHFKKVNQLLSLFQIILFSNWLMHPLLCMLLPCWPHQPLKRPNTGPALPWCEYMLCMCGYCYLIHTECSSLAFYFASPVYNPVLQCTDILQQLWIQGVISFDSNTLWRDM